MRFNKNNKDFTLIQSDKTSQPTSPSSILTTTGGKGKNHGRKGFNQQKNDKKGKEMEGKQEQQWMSSQLQTPPRKTKTTQAKSGMLDLKVSSNFSKSVGSRKNHYKKNKKK